MSNSSTFFRTIAAQNGLDVIPREELYSEIRIDEECSIFLWQKRLIKTVLVKKVDHVSTNDQIQRFVEETVRYFLFHDCKYVVRLFGANVDEHGAYLVFEHSGGTLESYVHERRYESLSLSHKELLKCCLDVGFGLKELQERGQIHCNIAIQNCVVFVDTERAQEAIKKVKITNFVLQDNLREESSLNELLFPLDKTPPEVWTSGEATPQSSMVSLGITFGEIISGKRAFSGLLAPNIRIAVGERPLLPSNAPLGLIDLVQQCWTPDLAARLSIHETIECLEGEKPYFLFCHCHYYCCC